MEAMSEPRRGPLLTLVLENGPGVRATESRTIDGGPFIIGRSEGADWSLDDQDPFVSRQHCVVTHRDGAFRVIDTSTNGLYLGDEEAPLGPGNEAELANGTILRVGNFVFRATLDQPAEETAVPNPRRAARPRTTIGMLGTGPSAAARETAEPVAPPKPVRALTTSRVLLAPPARMWTGSAERVSLSLDAKDLLTGEERANLGKAKKTIPEGALNVTAMLDSAPGFAAIRRLAPATQALSPRGETEWAWDVMPERPGQGVLTLSLTLVTGVDGAPIQGSFEPLYATVAVSKRGLLTPLRRMMARHRAAVVLSMVAVPSLAAAWFALSP